MNFATTKFGGSIEILAANEYVAVPVTITETDVVKAGQPISQEGKKVEVASCNGVLLYDVDPTKNPNGAMLVQGVIDATKVKASCGVDVTNATMKTAVPGIVVRENTGIQS